LTKDEGRKTKDERRRTKDQARKTRDEGRRTNDERRRTKDEGRKTKDERRGIMKIARNFREYKVWQDAVAYATEIYKVTAKLPYFERKGLCDQLQRAVVSISSNIAEGSARPSDADFAHFLDVALGSAYEVETQLLIAKNVGYIQEEQCDILKTTLINIEQQLSNLISFIRTKDERR